MLSQKPSSNFKHDLISYKKILDFSCYIKIERNGIKYQVKGMNNSISKVIIIERLVKVDLVKKTILKVEVKNSSNEEYFNFEINTIERIIDRMIPEGKMTVLINRGLDKFNVFFYKTTKEILENFLNNLNRLKKDSNKIDPTLENKSEAIVQTKVQTNVEKSQLKIEPISKEKIPVNSNLSNLQTNNILNNTNNLPRKRKLQELYANQKNNPGLQLKKFKQSTNPNDKKLFNLVKKEKINILDLPEDLTHSLFEWVDHQSLLKISLLNKECKRIFDNYNEKLNVRNDTPSKSLNKLLNRFPNLKSLSLGEGKFIKNENFKFFDVDLKNLNTLDISKILNLNDASICKLFSKTKSSKIYKLKFNFYLESLTSAISYILEFFSNICELDVISDDCNFSHNLENIIKKLEQYPRVFNPNLFNLISEILCTKSFLKNFSIYLFNFSVINTEFKSKQIFQNLLCLDFGVVVIEKVKDLSLLKSAYNLENLKIRTILIYETQNNLKKLRKYEFTNMIDENVDPEEQLRNLNLDFDNDWVELLISVFSKMKNLKSLLFGDFVNEEILKVINLFCKGLTSLTINSNKLNDDMIKETLTSLKDLTYLDLRGCSYLQGNCFTELFIFPYNLLTVKLSLQSYNFYHIIQFLRNKGVQAENYLYKNKI